MTTTTPQWTLYDCVPMVAANDVLRYLGMGDEQLGVLYGTFASGRAPFVSVDAGEPAYVPACPALFEYDEFWDFLQWLARASVPRSKDLWVELYRNQDYPVMGLEDF